MTITERKTQAGQRRFRCAVWDRAAGRSASKTFPTKAAARSWGLHMEHKIRSGELAAVEPVTLGHAAEQWLARANAGVVLNQSGLPYKPSVLRSYEGSLRLHVLPRLGRAKLADIRIDLIQDLIDRLKLTQAPSSVRNHVNPLRVIFADARRRRLMMHNPLDGIALPAGEDTRDRIASPAHAKVLLAALEQDRALWATAFYTGLRRGELMALDWAQVDLGNQTIRVVRSYDAASGTFVQPKSLSGARTVPFPDLLTPYLHEQASVTGPTFPDPPRGLVFGNGRPFCASSVRKRAVAAWAGLEGYSLHECRHTYASLMLAAGVDMTKVSKWLGHSSITITVDRYGHLVPGSERDDMARFQSFLERPTKETP